MSDNESTKKAKILLEDINLKKPNDINLLIES